MLTQNLPEYWESLYKEKKDSWDLGKESPVLLEFFKHSSCPKTGRVLVPGAGRGYDAAAWADRGHETLAVDFSSTAFATLSALAEKHRKLSVLNIDLFELTPKSTDPFDIIYEYGCFNAIHPGRRDEYFEVWDKMLTPNGMVIALFFPLIKSTSLDGPPHPTSEGELMARLDGVFDVQEKIVPKKSVKERAGKEEIWILRKAKH
jgi:cyclopropane fatty-acyl-phospholipid synthase-like methyltransferase